MISVDGYDVSKTDLYEMLRKKIIGKHPGGSHGLLRCWKQFRHMAGSGRGGGGGKGAGVVTKEELGVCFRNYGLKLDNSSDLDFLFRQFDRNDDGVISLDEWLEEMFGKWSSNVNTIGDDSEVIYEGLVYKPMEYLDIPVKKVLEMLRAKILRRMKGGSSAARRAWNQFRTMSGGDPEGVNEEDLGQALRYYGMPVNDTIRRKVFDFMDLQKNGIITFVEFWKTVLEEKGTCSFLDTLSYETSGSNYDVEEDMDIGDEEGKQESLLEANLEAKLEAKEGTEEASSSRIRAGPPRRLDDDGAPDTNTYVDFVDTMMSARISSRSCSRKSLVPTPGSIHAAVQEKMREIPNKNWRSLQKAFRKADGASRTGELDLKTFSYILSEYSVSLTREELRYASDVSGGGTGKGRRGNGPTIVDFGTLATRSAVKPNRIVRYVDFLRKFVESKVLLGSLKSK
jgi:Ca2+-binding EF-hand superfamily protein